MKRYTSITLYALIALAVSAHGAELVYTWIDDSGTTHFSETPPPESAIETHLIEVLPASGAAPGDVTGDDFYSVINQAERMQASRLESERLVAERKQAEAEASKARAEAQAALQSSDYNDNDTYYPVYPYYPYYPRYRHRPGHGNGHRPEYGNRPKYSPPRGPRTSLGKTPGMPHY